MPDWRTCILCHGKTTGREAREHVIPALLGGRATLPRGAMCNTCNNGTSVLDSELLNVTEISVELAFASAPNRHGKRRVRLGKHVRSPEPGVAEVILGEYPIVPGGRVSIPMNFTPRTFLDEHRLARSFCKIALNTVAFRDGPSSALHAELDPLREFARGAASGPSFWPYFAARLEGRQTSADLASLEGVTVAHLCLFKLAVVLPLSQPAASLVGALDRSFSYVGDRQSWARLTAATAPQSA